MLQRFVLACERLFFGHRAVVLGVLALVTVVAAVFASRLHMTAGFGKQLPLGQTSAPFIAITRQFAASP